MVTKPTFNYLIRSTVALAQTHLESNAVTHRLFLFTSEKVLFERHPAAESQKVVYKWQWPPASKRCYYSNSAEETDLVG